MKENGAGGGGGVQMCPQSRSSSTVEKQRFGYFQQLRPFPEQRFVTPGTLGCVSCSPVRGYVRAARSSEARTSSPVFSELT